MNLFEFEDKKLVDFVNPLGSTAQSDVFITLQFLLIAQKIKLLCFFQECCVWCSWQSSAVATCQGQVRYTTKLTAATRKCIQNLKIQKGQISQNMSHKIYLHSETGEEL